MKRVSCYCAVVIGVLGAYYPYTQSKQRDFDIELQEQVAYSMLERLVGSEIDRSQWRWERKKGKSVDVLIRRAKHEKFDDHVEFWFVKDHPICIGGGKVSLPNKMLDLHIPETDRIGKDVQTVSDKIWMLYRKTK
jgi:hypothetical protein